MTEHAEQVARLDRSKPPPSTWADEAIWNGSGQPPADDEHYSWGFDFEDGVKFFCTIEEACAAAWAHHEARHDPPGMETYSAPDGYWGLHGTMALAVGSMVPACPTKHADGWLVFGTESEARAAAWAWYWTRANLSRRLGLEHRWPDILTWSDEQVAEVNAYLDALPNGDPFTVKMPAVLRG